jgi:hypothetical protein
LGLCVILNAEKLVQSAEDVLTKTGFCYLWHETIKTNEDRSTVKQQRKEITNLMLLLSEKYSSECLLVSLVEYPSVFHPICDDSSKFGCSSNQASSSFNDTADSDWQQNEDKSFCTRSSDSASDLCVSSYQNDLSSVSDANHSSTKPNNISASEVSECQGKTQGNSH